MAHGLELDAVTDSVFKRASCETEDSHSALRIIEKSKKEVFSTKYVYIQL